MRSLDKSRLIRYGVAAVVISGVFFFGFLRELTFVNVLDAITLTGICFLLVGLFRTAKYLHFYDLPIYGGKKFVELFRRYSKQESKLGEYHEFVQGLNYQENFKEAYLMAGVLLGISLIVSMV